MTPYVIAFDADDTLWVNEPYFREAEEKFCNLLEDYLPHHTINRELLRIEIQNLALYGYGIKSFVLSMIETALDVSQQTVPISVIQKILDLGKEQLQKPVELLPEVEDTLKALYGKYRLVMATKGDLLDQERKLKKSGLAAYFHHIEIMSEKKEEDYLKLVKHLDIDPTHLVMVGNSLKSDILPVLSIGGIGFHVPYHTTWELEKIDFKIEHKNFHELTSVAQILDFKFTN